jgi:tetratricopeptide (TPR) repeat protein
LSAEWQISAGELFELMRPVAWAFSALLSALVFASARHLGFRSLAVAAWTLGTLFFPLIVLPLYLIARVRARRRSERAREASEQTTDGAEAVKQTTTYAASRTWKRIWPTLYLVAVLTVIALLFYRDYQSLDAHLWRANNAKLRGPHEKVINEYRAALRLEDNPHTHKLLAIELAAGGRAEEALAEFRAAERAGEPDERLPYYEAEALDALHREREAALEYKRFVEGPLCAQPLPDVKCTAAQARIQAIAYAESLKQK